MDVENVIEIEVDAEQAKQGLSAYEVYLSNGGTMTEEEWLASLKGDPGLTPEVGANENWFIGGVDTGLPSRGEPGEQYLYSFTVDDGTAVQYLLGEYSSSMFGYDLNNDVKAQIQEHVNTVYQKGEDSFILKGLFKNSKAGANIPAYERLFMWDNPAKGGLQKKPTIVAMNTFANATQNSFATATLRFDLIWSGDVATVKSVELHGYKAEFLATNYDITYNPKRDYDPATKKYVDDSIEAAEQASVDLSNYYTKEETDAAIANIDIPEVDLTNYYTKEETDNSVNEIGSKVEGITVLNIDYTSSSATNYNLTSESLTKIETLINKLYNSENNYTHLYLQKLGSDPITAGESSHNNFIYDLDICQVTTEETRYRWYGNRRYGCSNVRPSLVKAPYNPITFSVSGSWTDDIFTIKSASITLGNGLDNQEFRLVDTHTKDLSYYLSKTNTTSYTPTGDYHPATKKYVDDTVANNVPEVDLTNYYTKEETDAIIEEKEEPVIITNYTNENKELAQKAVDAMKQGKQVVIMAQPNANSGNNSVYGPMHVCSPNLAVGEDYSGTIYFKSSYFYAYGTNPYRSTNEIMRLPSYYQLSVSVSNGSVTSAGNISINVDYNGSSVLPVLSKTNKAEFTPTGDYNPATKKYVDDAVASAGGGAWPVYDFPFVNYTAFYLGSTLNTVTSTDSTTKTRASEIINDMKANGFGAAIINFYNKDQANSMAYMCISQFGAVSRNSTDFTFMAFNKSGHAYTQNYEFENVRVCITGTWTDDVFTCTKVEVQGISINFENGIASKKYVDDAVSAAITTVLEGEY